MNKIKEINNLLRKLCLDKENIDQEMIDKIFNYLGEYRQVLIIVNNITEEDLCRISPLGQ